MRGKRRSALLRSGLVLLWAGLLGAGAALARDPAAQEPPPESPATASPTAENAAAEDLPAAGADTEAPSPFAERCRREVAELHAFFESWFNGTVPNDEASFARFSGVLAEGFAIISPNGGLKEKPALLESLRPNYAPGGDQPIRIWIESFHLRRQEGDLAVVTYEEWQERGGQRRGRVATAVLREREGLPNDLEWLHVHETWLAR